MLPILSSFLQKQCCIRNFSSHEYPQRLRRLDFATSPTRIDRTKSTEIVLKRKYNFRSQSTAEENLSMQNVANKNYNRFSNYLKIIMNGKRVSLHKL